MAMDQRDWYRDLLKKRTGYSEKSDFRRPVDSEYLESEGRKISKKRWPFLLQFSVTVVICGFIFVVLKIISQLLR